jgi:hypothetical protein
VANDDDNVIRFPTFERIDVKALGLGAAFGERCYTLVNRTPVLVHDLIEWEHEMAKRGATLRSYGIDPWRVAETELGQVRISTVFLGLDHQFFGGQPLLFESMIFGGQHDQYTNRCSTWDEAEKMHEEAVALVRGNLRVIK